MASYAEGLKKIGSNVSSGLRTFGAALKTAVTPYKEKDYTPPLKESYSSELTQLLAEAGVEVEQINKSRGMTLGEKADFFQLLELTGWTMRPYFDPEAPGKRPSSGIVNASRMQLELISTQAPSFFRSICDDDKAIEAFAHEIIGFKNAQKNLEDRISSETERQTIGEPEQNQAFAPVVSLQELPQCAKLVDRPKSPNKMDSGTSAKKIDFVGSITNFVGNAARFAGKAAGFAKGYFIEYCSLMKESLVRIKDSLSSYKEEEPLLKRRKKYSPKLVNLLEEASITVEQINASPLITSTQRSEFIISLTPVRESVEALLHPDVPVLSPDSQEVKDSRKKLDHVFKQSLSVLGTYRKGFLNKLTFEAIVDNVKKLKTMQAALEEGRKINLNDFSDLDPGLYKKFVSEGQVEVNATGAKLDYNDRFFASAQSERGLRGFVKELYGVTDKDIAKAKKLKPEELERLEIRISVFYVKTKFVYNDSALLRTEADLVLCSEHSSQIAGFLPQYLAAVDRDTSGLQYLAEMHAMHKAIENPQASAANVYQPESIRVVGSENSNFIEMQEMHKATKSPQNPSANVAQPQSSKIMDSEALRFTEKSQSWLWPF